MLPTILDDGRLSKDALINALEFMKQQNSEDFDPERVHCHISELDSNGEAIITVLHNFTDDDDEEEEN